MSKLTGLAPLLIEIEPFEIEGRTYKFRRLGVKDTFKLLNILKGAITWGANEAKVALHNFNLDKVLDENGNIVDSNLSYLLAPLMGIPEVEPQIIDFLESTLREEVVKENGEKTYAPVSLDDYDKFPMGSELIIVANLSLHKDLESFFYTLKNLKSHPALVRAGTLLGGVLNPSGKMPLIESNEATDGQTSTS
jgi:hypothetical protein